MVHGPGLQDWSMDLGSMFCIRPSKGDFLLTMKFFNSSSILDMSCRIAFLFNMQKKTR